MLVYRVEHKDTGLGPYITDDSAGICYKLCGAHKDMSTHPATYYEFGNNATYRENTSVWFCCCVSMDLLKEWFKDVKHLFTDEYHICVYTVRPHFVIEGKIQAIFVKHESVLVDSYPVDML